VKRIKKRHLLLNSQYIKGENNRSTLFKFHLGHHLGKTEEGYEAISVNFHHDYFYFTDGVSLICNRYESSPLRRRCIAAAHPVKMLIGATPGKYVLTFTFYDGEHGRNLFDIKKSDHGPFDVLVNGEQVAHNVMTRKRQEYRLTIYVENTSERIEIEMRPAEGADFVLNVLELEELDGGKLLPVFPDQPRDFICDESAFGEETALEPMERIRELANFICGLQQENGYIGDTWGESKEGTGGTQVNYASSFPVRALLAAYELVGEKRYLEAALRAVDVIVGEQMPNGAFWDNIRGKATAARTTEKIKQILTDRWTRKPISDTGSVVQEICVAAHYAQGEEREKLICSAKKYADSWAAYCQTVNGAFYDGAGMGILLIP